MEEIEKLKEKVIEEMMKAKAEREENRLAANALKDRTRAMQDMIADKFLKLDRQTASIELRENLLKSGEEDLAKRLAEYEQKVARLKGALDSILKGE